MSERFRQMFNLDNFDKMWNGEETDLSTHFPFYPIDMVGMPSPGPDFVSLAKNWVGTDDQPYLPADHETMKVNAKKKAIKANKEEAEKRWLTYLYFRALYDDSFTLNINVKGRLKTLPFVLGHVWGREVSGPSQGPSPVSARVMVIGKNPSQEETEEKRNMLGSTSILFKQALDEVGIKDYSEWYVDNLARFANPIPAQTSAVAAAWANDCLPLIHQEIRILQPEYIVLLGSEVIAAMLGKGQTFKSTGGRLHEVEFALHRHNEAPRYHKAKIVTSIHPAAVSHDPARRDDLLKALRYVRDTVSGSIAADYKDPEADCEHIVCLDAEELNELANRLEDEEAKNFAIDTEFDGKTPKSGEVVTVQFSWAHQKAALVPLRDERGESLFGGGREQATRLLTRILKSNTGRKKYKKRLIFHFAAADLWWLDALGLDFVEDQFETPKDDPNPDGVERFFGWQKTAWEGGFDTILAAHAHEETAEFGLKELSLRHTTIPHYDLELNKWKSAEAKRLQVGVKSLPGFGACPREILWPYALYDADATFRIFETYNKEHGLLDSDRFGNCCRVPFWISMRACLPFYEMHKQGMYIDLERAEELLDIYSDAKHVLLQSIQEQLHWPGFNPASVIQCREMMFGQEFGKIDKKTGMRVSVRPENAISLNMEPYKSTGKRPKLWEKIRQKRQEADFDPAVDKETLEVVTRYKGCPEVVKTLRDYRIVSTITRMVLRPGTVLTEEDEEGNEVEIEGEDTVYDEGLLSFIQPGGTVHTNFSQTKETRRASSWSPPLQNISKKREPDYKRILRDMYKYSLRSIFVAPPGHVLVSSDYTGAELLGMAIQAGDSVMLDHCRRSVLPDTGYSEEGVKCPHAKGCRLCIYPHPDYYDIHSNVAVRAFRPVNQKTGVSCRKGRLARFDLKQAGLGHYRDAAKPVDFGYAYGMMADAAQRKAREGGADVTLEESQALIDGLEAEYPNLPIYYAQAAARAHDPCFMFNCFQGIRRTWYTLDEAQLRDLERQFKNFGIQSLVADAMNTAMANFRDYRKEHDLTFRLCLQLHDDVVSAVPICELEQYYYDAVPKCMTEQVDIWPCDFDGELIDDNDAPYHLTPSKNVYLRWGEKITPEQAREHGIPLEMIGSED